MENNSGFSSISTVSSSVDPRSKILEDIENLKQEVARLVSEGKTTAQRPHTIEELHTVLMEKLNEILSAINTMMSLVMHHRVEPFPGTNPYLPSQPFIVSCNMETPTN